MSDDGHSGDGHQVTEPILTTPDGETNLVDDVEHHAGGTVAPLVGAETFVPPAAGRFEVDTLAENPPLVELSYRTGRNVLTLATHLQPDQARHLADRLNSAAEAVDRVRADTDTDE